MKVAELMLQNKNQPEATSRKMRSARSLVLSFMASGRIILSASTPIENIHQPSPQLSYSESHTKDLGTRMVGYEASPHTKELGMRLVLSRPESKYYR